MMITTLTSKMGPTTLLVLKVLLVVAAVSASSLLAIDLAWAGVNDESI